MAPKKLEKDEIEFPLWNEDLRRAITVRRKGRLFQVSGVDVALFPISVMAEAIGRDVKTLRRWEREKTWPVPMWRVPDKRCKRWYSAKQIQFVQQQHDQMSEGKWGFSHSPHFPLKQFLSAVRGGFYKCDAVNVKGATT